MTMTTPEEELAPVLPLAREKACEHFPSSHPTLTVPGPTRCRDCGRRIHVEITELP